MAAEGKPIQRRRNVGAITMKLMLIWEMSAEWTAPRLARRGQSAERENRELMGSIKRLTAPMALAVGLVVLAGPQARAGNDYCRPVVNERLRALNVAEADVRRVQFFEVTRGRDGRVIRREANVWLHSCTGTVVINFRRGCRIRDVYTRGQCSVAGIKHC